MDGGRRILQQVTRPQGPRPAELSTFFSQFPYQISDVFEDIARRTALESLLLERHG